MTGRVLVSTGKGKGKTTAALGTALRAAGQGLKVCLFQFMKGGLPTGESALLDRMGIVQHRLGAGFSWTKESWDEDRALAAQGWELARKAILDGAYDLMVLDEINYVISYGLLPAEEVAAVIKQRPPAVHVILTGRGLAQPIAEVADTITEMVPLKHAFDSGIKATKGIEF
ncbi:Corrinoid adenosyltransferase [Desulfarculales bacterium]